MRQKRPALEFLEPVTPGHQAYLLDLLADWAPHPAAQKKILADNPAELYRF